MHFSLLDYELHRQVINNRYSLYCQHSTQCLGCAYPTKYTVHAYLIKLAAKLLIIILNLETFTGTFTGEVITSAGAGDRERISRITQK